MNSNTILEEIFQKNGCSAHLLKNVLSPDGIPGNHYERLIRSINEFASITYELKAITFCYTQDGIQCNKVVGIFKREQLSEALDEIREAFGRNRIVEDKFDESCDNYFIQFNDENDSYFYTSNYAVGELNL